MCINAASQIYLHGIRGTDFNANIHIKSFYFYFQFCNDDELKLMVLGCNLLKNKCFSNCSVWLFHCFPLKWNSFVSIVDGCGVKQFGTLLDHLICSNALDGTEYKEILQSHYHAEKGIRKRIRIKEKASVLYKIDTPQTTVMGGPVWSTYPLIPTQEFLFSTTSKLTSPHWAFSNSTFCAT